MFIKNLSASFFRGRNTNPQIKNANARRNQKLFAREEKQSRPITQNQVLSSDSPDKPIQRNRISKIDAFQDMANISITDPRGRCNTEQ